MRIATAILGVVLGAAFFAQSLLAYTVGGAFDIDDASTFGQAGVLAVLQWLFGSAFVFAVPAASIGLFAVASVICFAGGKGDLMVWGVASLALSGISYFGIDEKRPVGVR